MGKAIQPPFLPQYGSGAPGGSVPKSAVYFDTSSTPFTPYIYHSGAWHAFGGGAAGGNATQLQGIAISATPPTDGQVLEYVAANTDWEPKTLASSGPSIVQTADTTTASGDTATFGAAPTKGNLIVVFYSHFSTTITPYNPNTGLGYALLNTGAGSVYDGYGIMYKIAGVSENATQQFATAGLAGVIGAFEISGASGTLIDAYGGNHDQTGTSNSINVTTTGTNELIICMFYNGSAANQETSVSGFAVDNSTTGNLRAIAIGHAAAAAASTVTLTANYSGSQNGLGCAYVAIG